MTDPRNSNNATQNTLCLGVLVYVLVILLVLMTRCTIPTFVNVFAGNLFIHHIYIYIYIPCTWKFSQDKIFANFANDVTFANI